MTIDGLIQTFLAGVGVPPNDPRFVEVLTTLATEWQTSEKDDAGEHREDWEFTERGAEVAIINGVVEAIFLYTQPRRWDARPCPSSMTGCSMPSTTTRRATR